VQPAHQDLELKVSTFPSGRVTHIRASVRAGIETRARVRLQAASSATAARPTLQTRSPAPEQKNGEVQALPRLLRPAPLWGPA
jgi:hypothetical protein